MAAKREDTLFEQLLKWVGLGSEKVDVLVVGLDNSGKTTLCNYLVNGNKGQNRDTVPTVGYETQEFYRDVSREEPRESENSHLESLSPLLTRTHTPNPPVATILLTHAVQNFSFQVIDMAGAKQYREIWKQHFPSVNGIIFVVDSADKFRIASVVDELEMILENKFVEQKALPILFFANKMDKQNSFDAVELMGQLNLGEIKSHGASTAKLTETADTFHYSLNH